MSMRLLVSSLIVFGVAVSGATHARYNKGASLIESLREWERAERSDPTANLGRAMAFPHYVMGVSDALEGIVICTPQGVTVRQASAIVAKYINDNPRLWNEQALGLVSVPLMDAFPCKK
ncbi:Rap1a/Tai family immunity protein [Usitatibacter rugosus]|uniref:Rap1a/Tai family immunity protein n=1 Tax=Usitatibacter rugosus TaxID=2732067 RepID=UPI003CCD2F6E